MCSITPESKMFHRSKVILDWRISGALTSDWLRQEEALQGANLQRRLFEDRKPLKKHAIDRHSGAVN